MRALPAGTQCLTSKAARETHNRLLLVSAAFPPRTEIGALRWEAFTPFLVNAGWGVDVIAEHPPVGHRADWTRLEQLCDDVRVFTFERLPVGWHQQLLRVLQVGRPRQTASSTTAQAPTQEALTGNAGIRNAVRNVLNGVVLAQQSHQCIASAIDLAAAIIDSSHRVVISSGPPHYAHVAASRIAATHRLPHIADLRDPWVDQHANKPRARFRDQELRELEPRTLAAASLIVANTPAAERELALRHPALAQRIINIPNGSDLKVDPSLAPAPAPPMRITHCGSLYLGRDPRPFLRAIASVVKKRAMDASSLRVSFMGPTVQVEGRSLTEWGSSLGLDGILEVMPPGTRSEALDLLRNSTVAVAFQGETPTQVPAKIFEYVSFPLWILALVGRNSATAEMLADSPAIVLDLDDVEGIERAVHELLDRTARGERPFAMGADGRFSRARQAERLLQVLARYRSEAPQRATSVATNVR